jgi:hypothetical protein
LVLLGVPRSIQTLRPMLGASLDIMPGRHELNPALIGEVDQAAQFHSLVASDAGIRSGPGHIALEKVIDDSPSKRGAAINDLVGNAEGLSHVLGDADFTATALLPLLGDSNGVILMFPDLERNAMDSETLADEERSRNGAVNSAAHAEEYGWAVHRTAIVLSGVGKG